jgi:hypothetical protein
MNDELQTLQGEMTEDTNENIKKLDGFISTLEEDRPAPFVLKYPTIDKMNALQIIQHLMYKMETDRSVKNNHTLINFWTQLQIMHEYYILRQTHDKLQTDLTNIYQSQKFDKNGKIIPKVYITDINKQLNSQLDEKTIDEIAKDLTVLETNGNKEQVTSPFLTEATLNYSFNIEQSPQQTSRILPQSEALPVVQADLPKETETAILASLSAISDWKG